MCVVRASRPILPPSVAAAPASVGIQQLKQKSLELKAVSAIVLLHLKAKKGRRTDRRTAEASATRLCSPKAECHRSPKLKVTSAKLL